MSVTKTEGRYVLLGNCTAEVIDRHTLRILDYRAPRTGFGDDDELSYAGQCRRLVLGREG